MNRCPLRIGCVLAGRNLVCAFLFLYVICLVAADSVQAGEIYYWKDKDGNVQISDTPPETSVDRNRMKSINAPNEPAAIPQKTTDQKTAPSKEPPAYSQKGVTIYTNAT